MMWLVIAAPRPLCTLERDPVPILLEAGWAPEPVWTGAENLTPTRIRSRIVKPVANPYTDCAIPAMYP
jgi:hypothetical protein